MPAGIEYYRLLPEIILTIAGTLVMFLEAIFREEQKKIYPGLTLTALGVALWGAFAANGQQGTAFQGMMVVDNFATFFRMLVIVVGLVVVLCSSGYLQRERHTGGEYYALLL